MDKRVQCLGINANGQRCQRLVHPPEEYCWQHKPQATKGAPKVTPKQTTKAKPKATATVKPKATAKPVARDLQIRKVTMNPQYAVMHTDYTSRLAIPEYYNKLKQQFDDRELDINEFQPMYVYDTVLGTGLTPLSNVTLREIDDLQAVIQAVTPDEFDGTVVFRIENVSDAFMLYEILKETKYCKIFNITNFNYADANIFGDTRGVVFLNIDSESG